MLVLKSAISKVILLALISVIVVVGAAGYYLVVPQGLTSTPPVNNIPPPQPEQPRPPEVSPQIPAGEDPRADALRQAIVNHLDKLVARDVRGLMEIYIPDKAYAEWAKQAGVFAGRYDGTSNIRILWAQIVGNTESVSYKIDNYNAKIDGDRAEVTYKLFLNGTGKFIGEFEIDVDAIQKFVYVDGRWLMDNDVWVFQSFRTSVVADATVFPLHWRKRGDFSVWDDRIKELFPPGWR